ncbi:MAG: cyclic nucleotide-binding domain-containing protein, partial [Synechococcus sp. ELA619]
MTQTSPNILQFLKINDALARIPDATLEALASKTELQRCGTGQSLVFGNTLPERVFLVVEGNARLIGDHHGKPYTIERLGPGSFIGLASLLRAEACETVSAASPMVLASLRDAVVLELYQNDSSFKDWCDSHLWAAELGAVVETLTK